MNDNFENTKNAITSYFRGVRTEWGKITWPEKHQVIDMVTRLLRLPAPPKPDDTADAIAIALCHGQSASSLLRDMSGL